MSTISISVKFSGESGAPPLTYTYPEDESALVRQALLAKGLPPDEQALLGLIVSRLNPEVDEILDREHVEKARSLAEVENKERLRLS